MATIETITHDSGSPVSAHYTGTIVDVGGRASITVGAALNSSVEGLQIAMGNGNSLSMLESTTAPSTDKIGFTVYFDPNSAGVPTSGSDEISIGIRGGVSLRDQAVVVAELNSSGDAYTVRGQIIDDGATQQATSSYTITDAPHKLQVISTRATGASDNNGSFTLYVDDVAKETVTGLDLYANWLTSLRFRVFATASSTTSGNVYVDELLYEDLPVTFSGYDLVLGGGQP